MAEPKVKIVVETDASKAVAGFNTATNAAKGFNQQVTALGTNPGMSKAAGSAGNLAAQFNDLAVTMQMGQAPMTIAIQQGSQIAQALGTGGAAGAVKALGAGFLAMVNPVSLATIAIVGLGAAAVQYFMSLKTEVPKLDDALKVHGELITRIEKLWPGATLALKKYTAESRIMAAVDLRTSIAGLEGQVRSLSTTLAAAFDFTAVDFSGENFQHFGNALQVLLQGIAAGEPNFEAFRNSVNATVQTFGVAEPQLYDFGQQILKFADSIENAGSEFPGFESAIQGFVASVQRGTPDVQGFINAVEDIRQANPTTEMSAMADALQAMASEALRAAEALFQASDAEVQIGASANGSVAGVNNLAAALSGAAREARAYSAAMGAMAKMGVKPLSDFHKLREDFAAAKSSAKGISDVVRATQAYNAALSRLPALGPEPLSAVEIIAQNNAAAKAATKAAGGGGAKGGGGGKSAADTEREALERYAKATLDALDPMRLYNEEVAKINAALNAGLFTQDQAGKAIELAGEKAAQAAGKLGKAANAAVDFKKGLESWGNTVASSLADAIVEGENLYDVFTSLLKQLAKMALQMLVLQPLMNAITGGIGGMFGGGKSITPAAATAGVGAATYGMTRAGSSGGGGTGAIGSMQININTGDGKAGVVSPPQLEKFGQKVREMIQTEMVNQSRPGGLLWGR